MKIIFLGTSSMVPTKDRNTTGILLSYKGENILIDCGEGTQRQLRKAGISPTKITKILISHWHGDHTLGIPGLLQTLAMSQYKKPLEIYGPKKTKEFMKNMEKSFSPHQKLEYKVHEITKKSKFINTNEFEISAIPITHTAPCLAYSFKEKDKLKINTNYTKKFGLTKHKLLGELQKGKTITYKGKKITPARATIKKPGRKITFALDHSKTKGLEKFAENSDILISEATLCENLKTKAKERLHSTAKQSAELAKKAKVKKLVLTHFSQRYKSTKELEKEAKTVFKNTAAAKDFMTVKI